MSKKSNKYYKKLIGKKFNNLTILKIVSNKNCKYAYCKCLCGKFKCIKLYPILTNRVKGCGCLRGYYLKHGDSTTKKTIKFYSIWAGIKQRCKNPKNYGYKWYGGRGITYDSKWEKYLNFKKDMYLCWLKFSKIYGEENLSIERKDYNKNYNKENCTFIHKFNQQGNTKKVREFIAINLNTGEKIKEKNIRKFARKHNINNKTIWHILNGNIKKTKIGWWFIYITL